MQTAATLKLTDAETTALASPDPIELLTATESVLSTFAAAMEQLNQTAEEGAALAMAKAMAAIMTAVAKKIG